MTGWTVDTRQQRTPCPMEGYQPSAGRARKGADKRHFPTSPITPILDSGSPPGISQAARTLANCTDKALRLYEQEPPHLKGRRLGEYLRRWRCWAVCGLAGALAVAGGGVVRPTIFSLRRASPRPMRPDPSRTNDGGEASQVGADSHDP